VTSRVILEADGGSRGNPGPASYGALIRDAATGDVIAQVGETIGVATNNVAEYSGLIAGLELHAEHTPDAELEVRMDSKLVIEQMAGRWRVKHPDMKPLADRARRLAPAGVVWTWVPREQNAAADALANAALDDQKAGGSGRVASAELGRTTTPSEVPGWTASVGAPTTLVLLRHGVTPSTERKVFSGGGGADPGLTEAGWEQARRAGEWLGRLDRVDALVASPMRRTQETARAVADTLGLDVRTEPGLVEAAFGDWDGSTFAEIQQRWPDEMRAWLESTAVAPPGGEAFDAVYERVVATRDRMVTTYAGQTVVAVSHVTPIKMLVRLALDAPPNVIYKMELAPASITTIQWWADGGASLRGFNLVP
jgi:broad specificity phosphatase PhoE/ribonuclease HI